MNREQKRREKRANKSKMELLKLQEMPAGLVVGCVGAVRNGDDVGPGLCGQRVGIPYSAFGSPGALFTFLKPSGWSLGVSGSDDDPRPVHSILCPACTAQVMGTPTEVPKDWVEPV
jgi:hypothetical protein